MSRYNFAEFVNGLVGMDFHEAWRIANQEGRQAEREAIAGHRRGRKRERNYGAEEYNRQMGGLLFYVHSGVKANGLTSAEFALLRPLAEAWVQRGQFKPEALNAFGTPKPPAGPTDA